MVGPLFRVAVDNAVLLARVALSALFLVAALAKLVDRTGSRAAMAGFGVPPSLATPLGVALPLVELLVAAVLLPASTARWGALAALLLLGVFVAGIANVMLRGREAECHCFGQLHSARVGWPTLGRNLVLAAVAVLVFARDDASSIASLLAPLAASSTTSLVAFAVGAVAIVAVASMVWFMVQLLRQHGRMLLRMDALEQALAAAGIVVAGGARDAVPDSLDVGSPAPSFALEDLRGGTTSLRDLLAPALPLLLVFAHPGCTPCAALLPEIGGWQTTHEGALTIAVVSQGTADENRASVALHGLRRVVLQPGRETADAYAAYGTPSAVMVSSDGLIASPVAQGAVEMRTLLASVVGAAASNVGGSPFSRVPAAIRTPDWSGDTEPALARTGVDAG